MRRSTAVRLAVAVLVIEKTAYLLVAYWFSFQYARAFGRILARMIS
jgi:hypothetical protein